MINIESKLLDALQSSTCFGIAHDETVPECKQCDVKAQCKAKAAGENIATPKGKPKSVPTSVAAEPSKPTPRASNKTATSSKSSSKKASNTKPSTKSSKPTSKPTPAVENSNLPDFKPMSLDELKQLAVERNVDWKDYGNDSITRMRLIMNLKKSY